MTVVHNRQEHASPGGRENKFSSELKILRPLQHGECDQQTYQKIDLLLQLDQ